MTGESVISSGEKVTYKYSRVENGKASTSHRRQVFPDARYLARHHTGYTFSFGDVTKSARKGRLRNQVKFQHFKKNNELCVLSAHIDLYLQTI